MWQIFKDFVTRIIIRGKKYEYITTELLPIGMSKNSVYYYRHRSNDVERVKVHFVEREENA